MERTELIVLKWLKLKFISISKEKIIVKVQIELSLHPWTRSTITKCITNNFLKINMLKFIENLVIY
jgi:hypothetical protein